MAKKQKHIVEGEYRVRFAVEIVTDPDGDPREAFEAEYGGRGEEKMIAMLIREGADVEEVHISSYDGGHDDSCESCGHDIDLADSDTCMSCQVDTQACPGCRCMPGDGVTADCNHPGGCGHWKQEAWNTRIVCVNTLGNGGCLCPIEDLLSVGHIDGCPDKK